LKAVATLTLHVTRNVPNPEGCDARDDEQWYKGGSMKKILFFLFCLFMMMQATAQCSICTKTASQLGEGPARGLNAGVIYLMLTPFALIGVIGYRWWKREKQVTK
jgi:hypothetical protein